MDESLTRIRSKVEIGEYHAREAPGVTLGGISSAEEEGEEEDEVMVVGVLAVVI